MSDKLCETCRFYVPLVEKEGEGVCRAGPPNSMLMPNNQTTSWFPPVRGDFWCGCHEAQVGVRRKTR